MSKLDREPTVKQIGANGQISLGKKYAGRHVLIEDFGDGTWHVRTASVIPDSERWLDDPAERAKLDRALEWAMANPARPETTDAILARLEDASR